jgi:hypothetical protein
LMTLRKPHRLKPLDVPFYLSKVSINIYSTAGHLIIKFQFISLNASLDF